MHIQVNLDLDFYTSYTFEIFAHEHPQPDVYICTIHPFFL